MNKEEQLKLEFNALLEEFKMIRENILFDAGANRQSLTLTLTSAGLLVAGSPFIIQSQFLTLFLIFPIVFYALAWSQARYIYINKVQSNYLNNVIAPHLRQTLAAISPSSKKNFTSLLSWETYFQENMAKKRLTFLSISAARFGVPLLLALLSILIYFVTKYQSIPVSFPVWDIVLIILNFVFLAYTVYLGLWSSNMWMKES